MSFEKRIQIFNRNQQHVLLCFDFPPVFNVDLDFTISTSIDKITPKQLDIYLEFATQVRGSTNMSGDNFYATPNTYKVYPDQLHTFVTFEEDEITGNKVEGRSSNLDNFTSIEKILIKQLNQTVVFSEDVTFATKEISHNENSSNQISIEAVDIESLGINLNQFHVEAIDHIYGTGDNFLIRYTIGGVEPTTLQIGEELATVQPSVIYQIGTGDTEANIDVTRPTVMVLDVLKDMGQGEAENVQDNTTPEALASTETKKVIPTEIGTTNTSSASIDTDTSPPLKSTTLYLDDVTEFVIDISWDEVTDEDVIGYQVFANNVLQNSNPVSALEYSLIDLEQEVIYEIYVRVLYGDGKLGPHSNKLTEHLIDIISPVISDKSLTITPTPNDNEILIEFEKAVDGLTPENDLVYHLYSSEMPNLDTDPSTIEANGTLVDTQIDVDEFIVSGVTEVYYYNIVVEDEAGNKNLYNQEMYDIPLVPGVKIAGERELYYIDDEPYVLHTFEETGDVEVLETGAMEFCLIAGGGSSMYGGGGGGGVILSKSVLSTTIYPIVVGDGGNNSNGENSTFLGYTAIGGGRGGRGGNQYGGNGGSGGGGFSGNVSNNSGQGTEGQGNRGGSGYSSTSGTTSGGGGGYSSIGQNATILANGSGGDGIEYPENSGNYHAGGGGGGGNHNFASTASNGLGGGSENYGGGARSSGSSLENNGGVGVLFISYPIVLEPISITPITDQEVDQILQLELSDYFHHDIFQNQLEYSAQSNNANVTLDVNGSILTITGREIGDSDITVTASFQDLEAQQVFNADVTDVVGESIKNISSIELVNKNTDCITIPNAPHPGTNSFTWSVWFKYKDTAGNQRFLDNRGSGDSNASGIQISRSETAYWANSVIQDSNNNRLTFNGIPNNFGIDGNWHNIAITFDNDTGEGKFYGDYELLSEEVNSNLIGSNLSTQYDLTLGMSANNNIQGFVGNLDEVQIWNRALTREEIVEYGNKILTGNELGLQGYWNFEDRDPNQVTDLTANANHGTINGNPTYEYDAFDFDYALEFDGVDDYVEIGEVNDALPLQTMMFKIYTEEGINTNNESLILDVRGESTGNYRRLTFGDASIETTNATFGLMTNTSAGYPRTYIRDVFPPGWHHICIRWDNSNNRFDIFVDGVNRTVYSSGDGHVTNTSMHIANLLVGLAYDSSGDPEYGTFKMDDLAVFNYALTQREIQLNMNKELNDDEAGLVGYWKFDDLTDPTVAIDSSPNENHGIIHG